MDYLRDILPVYEHLLMKGQKPEEFTALRKKLMRTKAYREIRAYENCMTETREEYLPDACMYIEELLKK